MRRREGYLVVRSNSSGDGLSTDYGEFYTDGKETEAAAEQMLPKGVPQLEFHGVYVLPVVRFDVADA